LPTAKIYRHPSKRRVHEVEIAEVELETAKAAYHLRYTREPLFILEKGRKIHPDPKKRKAVWVIDKDDSDYLYFSCPWCLSINKLERHYAGVSEISVWCSGKCMSHLTIELRRPR
jgi:hypothetical protein